LTLFTFQTKLDFSGLGPFLFAGLIGLITAGFVHIFIPFSKGLDLVIACIGVLIFSGYILYDTQQIMKRLSVDEAILASLNLYLDFLNLFIYILRIVSTENVSEE
jgi:FtsH-binding integral membrane protein